ncbi:MAG: hypothetical protein QOF40_3656, partial [Actinomycetota bacterium]|nr:hypothetical protein [Actinomycetota bacterium]
MSSARPKCFGTVRIRCRHSVFRRRSWILSGGWQRVAVDEMGHTGRVDRSTLGARPKWLIALGVVALGVYVWVAAGLRPFTLGEEIMVAIPALIVFVGAWRPTRSKGTVDASRSSIAVWLLVVAVAVGWELYAYFSSPRHAHPTLS